MPVDLHASWAAPSDGQSALRREQSHLQARLQTFLDAQSEGLLAGIGAVDPQPDDASSTGAASVTPTATAESSIQRKEDTHIIPVRQPRPRKIGLRSARRGISRTILDLAVLKDEEVRILEGEVVKREEVMTVARRHEEMEAGLRTQIQKIKSEETSAHIEGMKGERAMLEGEIHDLETRLFEMKAKNRLLKQRIEESENGVQAKLSSYQNALNLARQEVKAFLARPPQGLTDVDGTNEGAAAIWSLPKDRRTLQMVEEHYGTQEAGLRQSIKEVENEKDALERGAESWKEVLVETRAVEAVLQSEMTKLDAGSGSAEGGMEKVLKRMRAARAVMEDRLATAEKNDWKLLVCCVGAELEALKEGQRVLQLASSLPEGSPDSTRRQGADGDDVGIDTHPTSSANDPRLKNNANGVSNVFERADSEEHDEDPDPDLLISQ